MINSQIDWVTLYQQHINNLKTVVEQMLVEHGVDSLLVHSGQYNAVFQDDQSYPFRVNHHFAHWVPITQIPECILLVQPGKKTTLYYFSPDDFWHKSVGNPQGFWVDSFDIVLVRNKAQRDKLVQEHTSGQVTAYIGEAEKWAQTLGVIRINPESLIDRLSYQRAYKSDYELACIQEANFFAAKGHLAVKDAFLNHSSEFEMYLAYLLATQQTATELPYSNIVCLNENCAILHYTEYDKQKPSAGNLSCLLDAGAQCHGYASDITRTFAKSKSFQALINRLDEEQQALIASIKPNHCFKTLHLDMHYRIAGLLKEFDICSLDPQEQVDKGVTKVFFPHGLGHYLGLHVHDAGGKYATPAGDKLQQPTEHPFLRLLRPVENRVVVTIEPGLYFIPLLLKQLKQSSESSFINWKHIDKLAKFGGIRVEDNIAMLDGKVINMTRKAFSEIEKDKK